MMSTILSLVSPRSSLIDFVQVPPTRETLHSASVKPQVERETD
jgi:hypothetical protein